MKKIVLVLTMVFSMQPIFGQTSIERTYPKTLWASNDTFSIRMSNFPAIIIPIRVSKKDTSDMGTDGVPGLYATLYINNDSIRFDYKNLPLDEIFWIHIESPKGKTVYRLHFNRTYALFSEEYVRKNRNQVQVVLPEVYELANIIWILSPSGQRADNLNKSGAYYEKVLEYFKPYLSHPLFKKLDFNDDNYFQNYYDFRENSFCYRFKNKKLVGDPSYHYVMGSDINFNSLFRKLIPLIEDFAQKSHYRTFFKSNRVYYEKLMEEQKELMPVRDMWQWLEKEFPRTFNSYKIVFSPLIAASHSTQNFCCFQDGQLFCETVMFVSGPNLFDKETEASELQKQGLSSGIVFTEIDHNYVNPITSKYRKNIDSIFSKREIWTSPGGDTKFYATPESIFNEYMTHAVFCLYALEKYDTATADFVIKRRESLMINRRHYIKFKEFNEELIALRKQNRNLKIAELFPKIIDWCKTELR